MAVATSSSVVSSFKVVSKVAGRRRSEGGDDLLPDLVLPVIEQRRRKVGASPLYWLIIPRVAACGTGMVRVMGLWNFRRRGSTVTMGETATRLPSNFVTNSLPIGCAC